MFSKLFSSFSKRENCIYLEDCVKALLAMNNIKSKGARDPVTLSSWRHWDKMSYVAIGLALYISDNGNPKHCRSADPGRM